MTRTQGQLSKVSCNHSCLCDCDNVTGLFTGTDYVGDEGNVTRQSYPGQIFAIFTAGFKRHKLQNLLRSFNPCYYL